MTAQQWANIYGSENATSSWRFWLAAMIVLVTGIALGVFAIPNGALPGTWNAQAERNALRRIDELEAELSDLKANTLQERMLRSTVEENLAQSNANADSDMVVKSMSPALIYTIYNPTTEQCVNLLSFDNGGEVNTVTLSPAHTCS
jgi:hypothetical protein